MKKGNCSGCGKEGIISWSNVDEEKGKLKGQFILICYSSKYHCCNDECYSKAREKNEL